MKKVFLYIMVFIYTAAGIYHFVNPLFYEAMMPVWLPYHSLFNYSGGIAEIILAIMLLFERTRKISSLLIIAMLLVFLFIIHIPMTLEFYKTNNSGFWISIIRLPFQFVLIWWAWLYTKPMKPQT